MAEAKRKPSSWVQTPRLKRHQHELALSWVRIKERRRAECIKGQTRHLGAQTRAADTASSEASGWRAHRLHESSADAEAGMLSGVSRKRSIRSNPCWFTEFCKSQCLSHFAAPFIVVRAETSVAESCNSLESMPPGEQAHQSNTGM